MRKSLKLIKSKSKEEAISKAIEFKSIAKGIEVSNEMIKKSSVDVLYLKSICPGKFLIIVGG
ncbi:BMC domain-containing protein, partial [Clostridioides difficile]|uniref:BMC domain-containing protein n=1 Tax=Clostridioides difficile TaxID=1496 RepID=UPI0020B31937